jgi:tetratricopeptide (TPR) repeat protein
MTEPTDDRPERRARLRVLIVPLALLGGYLGYQLAQARAGPASPPSSEPPNPPVAIAPVPRDAELDEWLAFFDRTMAMALRRKHLDLIDATLSARAIPSASGDAPALVAALDEWTQLRLARRDPDGALKLATRASELDRDADRVRLRALAENSDAQALRALAKETEVATWPARSIELLARSLVGVEARDAAARLLEHAIERDPADFRLRLTLADQLFDEGPPALERARVHYGAAQALRPDSVRAAVHHGWLLADHAGEPFVGEALLEAAVRRFPDAPIVVYAHGMALFKARHVDQARDTLRRAAMLDETFALPIAALAEIALDQQEPDRAVQAARASLALADTPDARDALGGALFAAGQRQEAIDLLEESVRRQPDDAMLRDRLSSYLVLGGRFEAALAHLKEAVHLDEWIAEVQNDYAWELVNSGDPNLRRPGQALEHTRRACEMEPGNAWYRNTLGVTLYRLGEYEECVSELENSGEMPLGGGPYDLFFLAMAKQKLGQHADALELFARATALMPDNNDELARVRAEAKQVVDEREGGGP